MNIQHVEDRIDPEDQPKRELTPEHLEALARGRKEAAYVRHYLDALELARPKRGRKPNLDKLRERLAELEQKIEAGNETAATRLNLIQERKDLERRLGTTNTVDLQKHEDEFVKVAASYAERRGFDYDSFREVGVPTEVLKRAGIRKKTVAA